MFLIGFPNKSEADYRLSGIDLKVEPEDKMLTDDFRVLQEIICKFRQTQVDWTEYTLLRAILLFRSGIIPNLQQSYPLVRNIR